MDNLEKFINNNREAFDNENSPDIWSEIDNKIETKKIKQNINLKIFRNIAAAIVIFLMAWFGKDFIRNKENFPEEQQQIVMDDNAENEPYVTLMEAEYYYTSEIEKKKEEIIKITNNNTEIASDIDMEMIELDKIYKELKDELNDNYNNEKVIEAMIQTYRIKLDILNTIQEQIKPENDENNNEDYHEI